jgi:hypothetical protein
MMSMFFKYTSGFSLWLAGLIFIAHLVLPHDHHIAGTLSNQDENCPDSNSTAHHHPGFPVHCHAFNDLASEKAIIYLFSNYIHPDNTSAGYCPDPFTFTMPVSGITITNNPEHLLESYLSGSSPLRAPPSLS